MHVALLNVSLLGWPLKAALGSVSDWALALCTVDFGLTALNSHMSVYWTLIDLFPTYTDIATEHLDMGSPLQFSIQVLPVLYLIPFFNYFPILICLCA